MDFYLKRLSFFGGSATTSLDAELCAVALLDAELPAVVDVESDAGTLALASSDFPY